MGFIENWKQSRADKEWLRRKALADSHNNPKLCSRCGCNERQHYVRKHVRTWTPACNRFKFEI